MLTLASNERIPLTASMRLLLEINHMNHCSPATVSRGGVVFVNAEDVGWRPVVDSWIEKLEVTHYINKANFHGNLYVLCQPALYNGFIVAAFRLFNVFVSS